MAVLIRPVIVRAKSSLPRLLAAGGLGDIGCARLPRRRRARLRPQAAAGLACFLLRGGQRRRGGLLLVVPCPTLADRFGVDAAPAHPDHAEIPPVAVPADHLDFDAIRFLSSGNPGVCRLAL